MNISVIKSVWDLKQVHRSHSVLNEWQKDTILDFYFYFGWDLEHSTHTHKCKWTDEQNTLCERNCKLAHKWHGIPVDATNKQKKDSVPPAKTNNKSLVFFFALSHSELQHSTFYLHSLSRSREFFFACTICSFYFISFDSFKLDAFALDYWLRTDKNRARKISGDF